MGENFMMDINASASVHASVIEYLKLERHFYEQIDV